MFDKFYGIPIGVFAGWHPHLKFAMSYVELEGLYMEFGVANGRSIKVIRDIVSADKIVYGFDSELGLPEAWNDCQVGTFNGSKMPESTENLKFISGWFEDTLPSFPKRTVAFMHVDSDVYSSAKTIFNNFKDYIVPGTVIVFDEYFNYPTYKDHEVKAFREFLDETTLKASPLGIVQYDKDIPAPASFIITKGE